jgi:hypothetical protein
MIPFDRTTAQRNAQRQRIDAGGRPARATIAASSGRRKARRTEIAASLRTRRLREKSRVRIPIEW